MKNSIEKGTLYIVGTPIGNMRDITIRALDTLKEVDIILAEDTRQTVKLLNYFEISKKMISYHRHNEIEKVNQVIQILDEGKNVAIVSDAGMPCVSDPGYFLVKELVEKSYPVEVIPGVTAFVTAVVKSGIDTTRFSFEGFISVNKKQRKERLMSLENETRTMLFYEAPHKLIGTLKDMQKYFQGRYICVARELTKKFEEHIRGDIETVIEHFEQNPPRGEFVIVVKGKDENEIKENEKTAVENISVEDLYMQYIREGKSKKEAVKLVAKMKNIDKNIVYKETLDM
ncbi:MAG: 16S rRNA (cytidine(1402)-2'-O)-methyltransferase [Clostridia bacterium]